MRFFKTACMLAMDTVTITNLLKAFVVIASHLLRSQTSFFCFVDYADYFESKDKICKMGLFRKKF